MLVNGRRLSVLVAAVMIAACSPSTAPGSDPAGSSSATGASAVPGGSTSGEAVTLNVWTLEGEEEFLPKIKDAFESSHPGTLLEFTVFPEDQYGTKVEGVKVSATAAGKTASPTATAAQALPNTGLSLLGAIAVGGALVAAGVALRRRERSKS